MHKITKGLKKKKKGKKSKNKDEELFKPEELEAYRREHHQQQQLDSEDSATAATATSGGNEEWKKFIALTSGVDDILKKTQGDLDRIKSTSFFQRVPPPSELRKQQEEEKQAEEEAAQHLVKEETTVEQRIVAEAESHIVEVSESESEEDEDDIFDTAYIDAIAAGDVKLAYIPESPTEQPDDDPFDTSYAEKAILGPNVERKGKKLVPLGSAVEILTGRVQAPSCASIKRPSTRRQILKEQNLLLGSFDETNQQIDDKLDDSTVISTLLDAPSELANEPIDLSKNITPIVEKVEKQLNAKNDILEEFDVLSKPVDDDDGDDEFAQLAAESLTKAPVKVVTKLSPEIRPQIVNKESSWNAFGEEEKLTDDLLDDPFDTTFAENIVPGEVELKLIEKEILTNDSNDFDFNPRATERYEELIRNTTVSIQITNPSGQRESVSSLERVEEDDLNAIKPIHRDLLGGSNTDLSQLGDQPLEPNETKHDGEEIDGEEEEIDFSDPFDTSAIDITKLPGTTELKFLEKELLGDIETKVERQIVVEEDDFDPRAGERNNESIIIKQQQQLRKVSFDLPLDNKTSADLLSIINEEEKQNKPLTPYYVRDNSIGGGEEQKEPEDPFDTSFACNIAPGQLELKLIENELINNNQANDICFDSDFNPRDEKQVALAKVVQKIEEISTTTHNLTKKEEKIDLLAENDFDLHIKVLTPAPEELGETIEYRDPFDTSYASNLLPGRAELKQIESELIETKANCTLSLLETNELVGVKALTPQTTQNSADDFLVDDFDPFDTSIANNIAPGPSELKLLESEFI